MLCSSCIEVISFTYLCLSTLLGVFMWEWKLISIWHSLGFIVFGTFCSISIFSCLHNWFILTIILRRAFPISGTLPILNSFFVVFKHRFSQTILRCLFTSFTLFRLTPEIATQPKHWPKYSSHVLKLLQQIKNYIWISSMVPKSNRNI